MTLLDPTKYPLENLAELYLKRWRIELWFDDIKTSMQMDVLRCKTPEMIEKEVLMHMIAYNLVRSVMQVVATTQGVSLELLSFKGAVDRLRGSPEWMERWSRNCGKRKAGNNCLRIAHQRLSLGR